MASIVWPAKPKPGEAWITSKCGDWRILKAANQSKRADVWPVVYILWDLRTKPAGLVGPFQTLEEAKHEGDRRAAG
jgi:hypothetical protein